MTHGQVARLGVLVLLLAFVLPVVGEMVDLAERGALDSWAGWAFRIAGLLLGIALVLWVLEKVGLRVTGARCEDCRKPVPYGHSLCADHLRARTYAAREKMHGERGTGV